jgi:DNA repair protein RadC
MLAQATDTELLSMLLGKEVAGTLASRRLGSLLEIPEPALLQMGLDAELAGRLVATAEIARRYQPRCEEGRRIDRPEHAVALLSDLRTRPKEVLAIILLDSRLFAMEVVVIGDGPLIGPGCSAAGMLNLALDRGAAAVIVAQNRPCGDPHPTERDRQLTRKVRAASRAADIEVVDHILVARRSYFSFRAARMV